MYLNKVVYSGYLETTPELISSGTSKLVQFSLCQERTYQSRGEEVVEEVYVLCEAWKSHAEDIAKRYKEGDKLKIEGYLRTHRGKHVLMVENYNKIPGEKRSL